MPQVAIVILNKIKKNFSYKKVASLSEAFKAREDGYLLIDIKSNLTEYSWVELSVKEALKGRFDALVTGPLGKNKKYKGHTDLLRKLCKREAFMCFIGSKFSTLLVTDHIPLKEVSNHITLGRLKSAILCSKKLLEFVGGREIFLLGLNPHAGEGGVLGREETRIYGKALSWARKNSIPVTGLIAPDTAFRSDILAKRAVMVANYHDQGLIPFKSLHKPYSTINLTLGLPFMRMSVDHGMAFDIAGKGMADETSMYKAITFALR